MFVYLALEICAVLIPLIYSYDRKLQFYLKIKPFTKYGIWGFNPKYHSGIMILSLPVEEWLFFIVIPYASVFLHDTLVYLSPNTKLSSRNTKFISIVLVILMTLVVITNITRIYTAIYLTVAILAILFASIDKTQILNRLYITFLIILIPFFLVNSVLTGSFIVEPVVWYNNSENLGIRIGTVPVEDISYAFGLILFNILLINKLAAFFEAKPQNIKLSR